MPNERPILFTGEMVRAILDGRKTQTRRLNGLSHVNVVPDNWRIQYLKRDQLVMEQVEDGHITDEFLGTCPYGVPGETRLWVREAFTYWECEEPKGKKKRVRWEDLSPQQQANAIENASHWGEDYLVYKADGAKRSLSEWKYPHEIYEHCIGRFGKTVSPIHMPKWACRLWLEITEVRVERLQEITEGDAKAEGVKVCPNMNGRPGATGYVWPGSPYDLSGLCHSSAITAFFQGFESINGADSWADNPWVWVLTFKPHERSAA